MINNLSKFERNEQLSWNLPFLLTSAVSQLICDFHHRRICLCFQISKHRILKKTADCVNLHEMRPGDIWGKTAAGTMTKKVTAGHFKAVACCTPISFALNRFPCSYETKTLQLFMVSNWNSCKQNLQYPIFKRFRTRNLKQRNNQGYTVSWYTADFAR